MTLTDEQLRFIEEKNREGCDGSVHIPALLSAVREARADLRLEREDFEVRSARWNDMIEQHAEMAATFAFFLGMTEGEKDRERRMFKRWQERGTENALNEVDRLEDLRIKAEAERDRAQEKLDQFDSYGITVDSALKDRTALNDAKERSTLLGAEVRATWDRNSAYREALERALNRFEALKQDQTWPMIDPAIDDLRAVLGAKPKGGLVAVVGKLADAPWTCSCGDSECGGPSTPAPPSPEREAVEAMRERCAALGEELIRDADDGAPLNCLADEVGVRIRALPVEGKE